MRLATASTAATFSPVSAAASATSLGKVLSSWNASEFKSHSDVLTDSHLESLERLLCLQKIRSDWVRQKAFTSGLEFMNLSLCEFKAGLLLLIQFLTTLVDRLVAEARLVIRKESFDLTKKALIIGVLCDCLTQLAGFRHHCGIIVEDLHVVSLSPHPLSRNGGFKKNLCCKIQILCYFPPMTKRIAPIAAAWIASCGAAYYVGNQSDEAEDTTNLVSAQQTIVRTSDRSTSSANSPSSRRSMSERDAEALSQLTSSLPDEQIKEIAQISDPIERTEALLALVGQLSPGEFQDVVASFRDLGLTRERMGEYAIMLTAWAKTDPVGALDYAKENTGTAFARQTILATWAQTQPDAAISWAEENFERGNRDNTANPWLVGIIKGLAQSLSLIHI